MRHVLKRLRYLILSVNGTSFHCKARTPCSFRVYAAVRTAALYQKRDRLNSSSLCKAGTLTSTGFWSWKQLLRSWEKWEASSLPLTQARLSYEKQQHVLSLSLE